MPLAGRGRVGAVMRRLSRLGFEPTAGGAALAAKRNTVEHNSRTAREPEPSRV
jgi:hypothetical protein